MSQTHIALPMSKDPYGSIESVITREGTDTPIPGVQATLSSAFQARTDTDESGRFLLENLIAGRYIIHAGCDSYVNTW